MPEARPLRTEAEVASILVAFESRHNLFALNVCEISVWRLIRFPVGFALLNLPLNPAPLPATDLLAAVLRSLYDFSRLPRGSNYAVKSYASALRLRVDAGHEDLYFQRLLERVPGGIRLHTLNATGYSDRVVAGPTLSVDCTAIQVIGSLLARILPVHRGHPTFALIASLLATELGLREFGTKRIQRMFSSFWWQSRMYAWLLRRLKVRSVFAADTGERALLKACHDTGKRFVELQHGIFTSNHPDAIPSAALDEAKESSLLLPDAVALYGEYWKRQLAGSALGKTGRLVNAGASVIEGYRAKRRAQFAPSQECPGLIVTTQGIDRKSLCSFLSGFLGLYRKPCRLAVKLHPAFDNDKELYSKALGGDPRAVIIAGHDEPNTYELIALADVHLSIASACHYDALGIGTPTIVIGLSGYSLVQNLIDSEEALFAANPETLADIVELRSWKTVSDDSSANYYRHGFASNLLPLIN